MSSWFRLDRDFLDNAKVIAAGQDGALLFLEVLSLNERGSRDGILTPAESTAAFLGRRLCSAFGWQPARAAGALASLIASGLVELADGCLRICGWDDEWRPPLSEAERARAARNRKRGVTTGVTSTVTTGVTGRVTTRVTTRPTDRSPDRSPDPPSLASGEAREEGRKASEEPQPQTPKQHLQAELQEAGVLSGDPTAQRLLAAHLTECGCTSFDLGDLAKAARAQSTNGKPAGLLTYWLRDGKWRDKLDQARGVTAPIYGEPEREKPTSTTAGHALDAAQFGLRHCDECGVAAMGRHGIDHGPIEWAKYGWRPGQPPPVADKPEPKPEPVKAPKPMPPERTPEENLARLKSYAAKRGKETAS